MNATKFEMKLETSGEELSYELNAILIDHYAKVVNYNDEK